jgi:UDP-GlcNAc:undecaprenyl-phosphate GlcNAc-1-phosphate transferase
MRSAPLVFAISLVVSMVATLAARALARRWGLLDHALSSRKIHGKPIPRLGGIAIVLAFYAPVIGLVATQSTVGGLFHADRHKAFTLLAGGAAIVALGIYDDLRGADAKLKLAVQLAVAALACAFGVRIVEISLPLWEGIRLGWFSLPVTLLWIAGLVNAVNLIDGLDGLAGGVALIAVATLFALSVQDGQPLMTLFTAALGGSILGFLFFNFHPASIFMGDTGSMFLGFVLATASIETHEKVSTAVSMLVPMVALGIPIADTLLAMARRTARGVSIFSADREHIHHKLLALGWSQRRAVLIVYAAAALLALVALALARLKGPRALALVGALAVAAILALRALGYVRLETVRKLLDERRRNLELRRNMREIAAHLRGTAQTVELWESVKAAAPLLGARGVAMNLVAGQGILQFAQGLGAADLDHPRSKHGLLGERRVGGHLEFEWRTKGAIDRNTEIAVEALCHHIEKALRRMDLAGERLAPARRGWRARRMGVAPVDQTRAQGRLAAACAPDSREGPNS